MTIPEDWPLVEKMLKEMDKGRSTYETVIRIKTDDGVLKYVEVNLYTKFNENGEIISRYGLMKDVSTDSDREMSRPVDLLLKGFKNNKKLALLIEPLNLKQYEFSQGFYYLIEKDPLHYKHSRDVIDNIVEDDVKAKLVQLFDGNADEVDVTFTYNANGDENNQKICELYIERFEYGSEIHSIGFLTDISGGRNEEYALI